MLGCVSDDARSRSDSEPTHTGQARRTEYHEVGVVAFEVRQQVECRFTMSGDVVVDLDPGCFRRRDSGRHGPLDVGSTG